MGTSPSMTSTASGRSTSRRLVRGSAVVLVFVCFGFGWMWELLSIDWRAAHVYIHPTLTPWPTHIHAPIPTAADAALRRVAGHGREGHRVRVQPLAHRPRHQLRGPSPSVNPRVDGSLPPHGHGHTCLFLPPVHQT